MQISVDYVHSLTYYIAAKQLTAFPSPNEWNAYCQMANMDLYNYYQDEREKMLLSIKSGETLFVPETLTTFVVNEYPMPAFTQSPSLPVDYAYDIAYKIQVNGINMTIKKVDYNKLESYLNSTIDNPTFAFPIYVELANNFLQYPTIPSATYLTYYRYPVAPFWGYTVVNGVPTYDPASSIDFEWEMTEITRIVSRILKYMSISIRDTELEQYADQMVNTAS